MGDWDLSRRVVLHSKASGGVRDVSSIVCHHLFSSYLEAELSIVEPFLQRRLCQPVLASNTLTISMHLQ